MKTSVVKVSILVFSTIFFFISMMQVCAAYSFNIEQMILDQSSNGGIRMANQGEATPRWPELSGVQSIMEFLMR